MMRGQEAIQGPHLVDILGHRIPLSDDVMTLGRDSDCHATIPDRRASRYHAELRRDDKGNIVLRDLDSTNGTRLNGEPVRNSTPLRDGDVIEIAAASFTFRDPDATLNEAQLPCLILDEATGDVWVDRRPVRLSDKQYALLKLLWNRQGGLCSKEEIARTVWPECHGVVYDYQIESLIKRLRAKLEPDPHHPTLVITVRGRGYRLVA